MHKKNGAWMTSITAKNDSKVCAMNKNNRIELKCAIMTGES